MPGRSGLKAYNELADFTCNSVLEASTLNTLKDNVASILEKGDTVISQQAGKDGGWQKTILGYSGEYTSAIMAGTSQLASCNFYTSTTLSFQIENPGYTKYVMIPYFRLIESDDDGSILQGGAGFANFKQVLTLEYVDQGGLEQGIIVTDSLNTFYATNEIHTPFLSGNINVPPTTGTSSQVSIKITITNTDAGTGATLTDGIVFSITDKDKWGGLAGLYVRLHN